MHLLNKRIKASLTFKVPASNVVVFFWGPVAIKVEFPAYHWALQADQAYYMAFKKPNKQRLCSISGKTDCFR